MSALAGLANSTEPASSLVSGTEEIAAGGRVWRLHDGPRDFVGRRGGDRIARVDERLAEVQRIIRGQSGKGERGAYNTKLTS